MDVNDHPHVKPSYLDFVRDIYRNKHPDANAVLFAGSLSQGKGTRYSDFDLVVLYEEVDHPYRESFREQGKIVETWVHDPETVYYFMTEFDRKQNVPTLAQMIVDGIEVPGTTDLTRQLKTIAATVIANGPLPFESAKNDHARYMLTSYLDDIRDCHDPLQLQGAVNILYEMIGDYFFSVNRAWGGKGKYRIAKMKSVNSEFGEQYFAAFATFYQTGATDKIIEIAENLLNQNGGLLYDYLQAAGPECRRHNE